MRTHLSDSLVQFLATQMGNLNMHDAAIAAALGDARNNGVSNVDTVQAVTRAARLLQGEQSIPDNSLMWDVLRAHPHTAEFLRDLTAKPFQLDIRHWVNLGVLEEDDDVDVPDRCIGSYYIRVHESSVQNARKMDLAYLRRFPADVARTLFNLLALRTPDDNIRLALSEALASVGHSAAVDSCWNVIQNHKANVSLVPEHVTNIAHVYIGQTIANTAAGRSADDNGDRWRRYPNWRSSNGAPKMRCFRVVAFDVTVAGPLDFRTQPHLSHRESVLICARGSLGCLNSATGGYVKEFAARPNVFNPITQALVMAGPNRKIELATHDPALAARVCVAIDDEASFWAEMYPDQPCIANSSLAAMKTNISNTLMSINGVVDVLTVMKDITAEDFFACADSIFGATTGPGLRTSIQLMGLLDPTIAEVVGDLPIALIRKVFGPHVDLFRLTLEHVHGLIYHVMFLGRLFAIIKPAVLVTWSKPVASLIITRTIPTLMTRAHSTHPEDMASFMDGDGRALLNIFSHDEPCKPPHFPKHQPFSHHLGQAQLTQLTHDPTTLSIHLPLAHPGLIKYDPALSLTCHNIQLVTMAIGQVLVRLVDNMLLTHLPNQDLSASFSEVLNRLEDILSSSGLSPLLSQLVQDLDTTEQVLKTLRNPIQAPPSSSEFTYQPRACAHTRQVLAVGLPMSSERTQQLLDFQALARDACEQGLNPDPDHLVPIHMHWESSEFAMWFKERAEHCDVGQAAAALGRTEEGAQRAAELHKTLPDVHRKNAAARKQKDDQGISENVTKQHNGRPRLLCEILHSVADISARQGKAVTGGMAKAFVFAHCPHCTEVVLKSDRNDRGVHHCSKMDEPVQLLPSYFPDMQRIFYPHCILSNPELVQILGPEPHGLQSCSARDILMAAQHLPPPPPGCSYADVVGSVYYRSQDAHNHPWLVTMAMDLAFQQLSQCPAAFYAQDASVQEACWQKRTWGPVCRYFADSRSPFLLRCGYGFTGVGAYTVHHKSSHGSQPEYRHTCKANKSTKRCSTEVTEDLKTFFHLPSYYLRRLWHMDRVEEAMEEAARCMFSYVTGEQSYTVRFIMLTSH
jgi:hypothetical protein